MIKAKGKNIRIDRLNIGLKRGLKWGQKSVGFLSNKRGAAPSECIEDAVIQKLRK
jgi:hypothetical protein